jgi:phosphoglycerate kinase
MKSVKEADVSGKRVVVRCDFDVPVKNGQIEDETRINNSLPTLKYLLGEGAKLFLLSKMGRPKFRDPDLSLRVVVENVAQKLGKEVVFKEDLNEGSPGDAVLLENLRFWPEEEKGDLEFSKKLALFGDLYVNECFAASHRSDASFVGVPKFLPAFAGLNLVREVTELRKILEDPKRPLIAIIGGAKLETKLPAINNLAKISEKVLVGGRLMFEVGEQVLPQNVVVAPDDVDQKDIGLKSIGSFESIMKSARTIVWNGPMGVFEEEAYMQGSKEVAEVMSEANAYKVVGGGDTIAVLEKLGLLDKMDYVSTGGGAMLEFLAGKKLPGLAALGYYD